MSSSGAAAPFIGNGDGRLQDPSFSSNEKLLNDYVKLHPMLTSELTRKETLQILSDLVERAPITIGDLPVVTKPYEDTYLRPARVNMGERPCILGEKCLCQMMARIRYGPGNNMGFTCTEFLLPREREAWLEGKGLPSIHGKCLVCYRYFCTYMHDLSESDEEIAASLERLRVQRHTNCASNEECIECPPPERMDSTDEPKTKRGRVSYEIESDTLNAHPVLTAEPTWHDLNLTSSELPRHVNAVGVDGGYRQDVLISPGPDASDSPGMRDTLMGTVQWRKLVRFESSHYKYVITNDEPRLIQVHVAVNEPLHPHHLNISPSSGQLGRAMA